jgi:magnesium transporter
MQILDRIDADAIRRALRSDEFFWLDLDSPTAAELATVGELLEIHGLALEDSQEFEQRPKLDEYGDRVLLVFYAAGDAAPLEIHLHLSGSWIVSVHRGAAAALAVARRRMQDRPLRTEEEAVYHLLDALTDSFFPLIERLEEEVDSLEEAMLAQPSPAQLQRLFALRRDAGPLRRIVSEQRDTMASGRELIERLPGFEADIAHDYFRDVYDHLIRIGDDLDGLRDRLTTAMELHLSNQSNRLNEVMKQLTIIATIFLPLTFVTGFFGQNFGWLVGHVDSLGDFLVLGVGGLVVPGIALLVYFRRAGFLGG